MVRINEAFNLWLVLNTWCTNDFRRVEAAACRKGAVYALWYLGSCSWLYRRLCVMCDKMLGSRSMPLFGNLNNLIAKKSAFEYVDWVHCLPCEG